MTSHLVILTRTVRAAALSAESWKRIDWVFAAWNWKSALLSSVGRAAIFFGISLQSGIAAALAAGQTEFIYRALAAGFYGGLTARLSRMEPPWIGTWSALIVVPAIAHTIEYSVHYWAGTANAGEAVLASIAVSVATTRVNVFAMRRGLLVTGANRHSLRHDLAQLWRLALTALPSLRRRSR